MKEKRDILFRKSRPLWRPLQVYDGDKYHKDMGILWTAYESGCFEELPRNLKQEDFAREVENLTQIRELLLAEDFNSAYKESKGPIAFASILGDGWRIEPHVEFFPWASRRNILRSSVGFFQMVRYKKIGVCIVKSLNNSTKLFDKCKEYGVLFYVGKIVNGDPRGDEYVYSIRGKLKCQDHRDLERH